LGVTRIAGMSKDAFDARDSAHTSSAQRKPNVKPRSGASEHANIRTRTASRAMLITPALSPSRLLIGEEHVQPGKLCCGLPLGR
jgi:hypothetical protein